MKLLRNIIFVTMLAVMSATVCFAGSWGYEGQEGVYAPEDWGHVSAECNGSSQSPIDIVSRAAVRVEGVSIDFNYKSNTVDYLNNGHAVTAYPNNERVITIADGNGGTESYTLIQFHFHTLSEHTVNGRHYDMELHLVHANAAFLAGDPSGKLAVLGVFIEAGDENNELKEIFEELPHASHTGEPEVLSAKVVSNYYKLLPENRKVYSYQGSLTTPGCNEIVTWFVFDEPIELSHHQIESYRHLFVDETTGLYDTNRPVQPLNGRTVIYGRVTGATE